MTLRLLLLMALLAGITPVISGCHTVAPATRADASKLTGKKHVHLVLSTRKDRGFRNEIERNLTGRGFVVTTGSLATLPPGTELYVSYDDRWTWDMVMYPKSVRIAFHDAKTGAEIGSAEFKNTFFHTFPDPPEITDELIGRIFGEPEGSHMQ